MPPAKTDHWTNDQDASKSIKKYTSPAAKHKPSHIAPVFFATIAIIFISPNTVRQPNLLPRRKRQHRLNPRPPSHKLVSLRVQLRLA